MMAESVVDKTVCSSCGSSIRDRSAFCYSCGEPVVKSERPENIGPAADTNGQKARPTADSKSATAELAARPIPKPAFEELPAPDPEANKKPKLRTAAQMRGRVRSYSRKPVEISWVEREYSWKFVILSAALVIFTACLLALALYLK